MIVLSQGQTGLKACLANYLPLKYCFIFLSLCLGLQLGAQAFSSFGADFTRTVNENGVTEQSSGKIRIQFPSDLMVFVETPVKQWLHYSQNHLLIYYPDELKLFRLNKSSAVAPPFISSIISVVKEDFGLSELGFTIQSNSYSADTLRVRWQAPDSLKQVVSIVELQYQGRKLTSSYSYDARDSLVLANRYSGHYDHRGYQVPMLVNIWQRTAQGGKSEEIAYSNPDFDKDYTAFLKEFGLLEQQSLGQDH